jgi:predicted lactoylglutathione lyase
LEQRLSLVTLAVADLARATAFYEALGWQRGMRQAEGVSFFQAGGVIVSLYPRANLAADSGVAPSGSGFGGIVLAYDTRDKAEVDSVLAEAAHAGGRITRPAADACWGGYSGCFADLDGHLWEVAWNPDFTIGPDGAVTLPG